MYSSNAIVVWFARLEKPMYQFAASWVAYRVTRSKSGTDMSLLESVATSSEPSVQKSFFPSTRRVCVTFESVDEVSANQVPFGFPPWRRYVDMEYGSNAIGHPKYGEAGSVTRAIVPWRSGWPKSTPSSTIATFTPAPVMFRAHASGALWLIVAFQFNVPVRGSERVSGSSGICFVGAV